MPRPATADPRADLINWDILNWEAFPPIEEWTEDEWDDAALATVVHYEIETERREGKPRPTISLEKVMAKHGITWDDLKNLPDVPE